MWCGRCLVMPGVNCRPIRWNRTRHHVQKGSDTTRISGLGTPSIGPLLIGMRWMIQGRGKARADMATNCAKTSWAGISNDSVHNTERALPSTGSDIAAKSRCGSCRTWVTECMYPCVMTYSVLPKIASNLAFTRVTVAVRRGRSHSCPTAFKRDPSQLVSLQHLFMRAFYAEYEMEQAYKEALVIADER